MKLLLNILILTCWHGFAIRAKKEMYICNYARASKHRMERKLAR